MSDTKNKLDIKYIGAKIVAVFGKVQKHLKLIFAVVILLCFVFIIFRINILSNTAPNETEIEEKISEVKKPRVDKNAVDTLNKLEDQNVVVQVLFQEARENPFTE